jgi:chromosomal replication initiation ATPase DnaA
VKGQLAFDLPADPAMGRADFFVSQANAAALAMIDQWRDWPFGRMVLTGPPGSGKSHLATIWTADSGAEYVTGAALGGFSVPALARSGAVAVDDAHLVAGNTVLETALFHLINFLAETNGALLLIAPLPPRDWALQLPDLVSRVQATALTSLHAPDDALLSAVLIKLFADRQIEVDPTLIPFLVARMDRSFGFARAVVDMMDRLALERSVSLNRGLAADVLSLMSDKME